LIYLRSYFINGFWYYIRVTGWSIGPTSAIYILVKQKFIANPTAAKIRK
jgi:hypothetical protein